MRALRRPSIVSIPVVQGVDAGVGFLDVLAEVLISTFHRTPKGQANPEDGNDDGDGVRVHAAYPITLGRLPPGAKGPALAQDRLDDVIE